MGDAGSLNFEGGTSSRGIGKIGDMMPTADEDVGNGIDVDGSGTSGGLSGGVSGGVELVSIILKQWIWLKSV